MLLIVSSASAHSLTLPPQCYNCACCNGHLVSPQPIETLCSSLQNDFTPEEEEEVRRENQWAFD